MAGASFPVTGKISLQGTSVSERQVVPEPGWGWGWGRGRDRQDSHGPVLIKPLPRDRGTAISGLRGEVGVGLGDAPGGDRVLIF